MIHLICSNYGDDLKKNPDAVMYISPLCLHLRIGKKNEMRGRPKGSGRRSVAIPLTRIHILHRRSAERGRG